MGTCGWALQAKEERLAEEKAKKKAAAKKMEEVEVRRKQEEEARRLRWLQQVRRQVDSGIWASGRRWGGWALPQPLRTAGHTPLCWVNSGGSVTSSPEDVQQIDALGTEMVTVACFPFSVEVAVEG